MRQLITPILLLAVTSWALIACAESAGPSQSTTIAPTQSPPLVGNGQHPTHKLTAEPLNVALKQPWGLAFLDQQTLLVTEKNGTTVQVDINRGKLVRSPVPADILVLGQGGLLDIAKAPLEEPWFYFTYAKKNNQGLGVTALARALWTNTPSGELKWTQWQELLETRSAEESGRHFGSRIAFDDSGHVFFSIGDRGNRDNGQNLTTHAGTIVRLTLDGHIPEDNPFLKDTNALPEIYSYGHRNPQGLFFDSATQKLWSIEHGPRGGDEINVIEKGGNYGWAVVSHGKEYWGPMAVGEATSKPGMIDPIKIYIPSIAPSNLLIYRGQAFPAWQGTIVAGALKLKHINQVFLNKKLEATNEVRLLESLEERIRDLETDHQGWIYFCTDSGKLYRIRPK